MKRLLLTNIVTFAAAPLIYQGLAVLCAWAGDRWSR